MTVKIFWFSVWLCLIMSATVGTGGLNPDDDDFLPFFLSLSTILLISAQKNVATTLKLTEQVVNVKKALNSGMPDRASTWAWQAVTTACFCLTVNTVEVHGSDGNCGSLQSAAAACTQNQWLTTALQTESDLRVTASAGLNKYKLETLHRFSLYIRL